MRARNVMTSEIVAVASSATLLEAVRELVNTNASALPVVDGGNQLIGLISEIDIIRHLLSIDNEAASFRLQFEAGMPMPDPIAKAFWSTPRRRLRCCRQCWGDPPFGEVFTEAEELACLAAAGKVPGVL